MQWLEVEIAMTKQLGAKVVAFVIHGGNKKMVRTCNLKDKHGATESPPSGTFVRADKQDIAQEHDWYIQVYGTLKDGLSGQ